MDESECQSLVNEWAGLYGYDDAPKVVFTTNPRFEPQELEPGQESSPGWFCEGIIKIDINLGQKQTELEILFVLGHEFVHWLQFKQGKDFNEEEADEMGVKLAKNEFISRASQYQLP